MTSVIAYPERAASAGYVYLITIDFMDDGTSLREDNWIAFRPINTVHVLEALAFNEIERCLNSIL